MLRANPEWKKKGVRIIGLSIDDDPKKVSSHVTNKGWTSVEHYICLSGQSKEINPMKLYEV
jgi:alkyl hydroperoxide reductase subunit AhpC